ncbi:serine hydrolase, partial [Rhizobium johnstonii]|uniref:serine hydrolase n=1 Tax=Rhizobium johnstonii TaxID=3019933 RepID=UPI003F9AD520
WSDAPTGYVLLGMALEAATDKSWNQLYDQYVLSPLGLESTTFPGDSTVTVPGAHPTGYLTPRGADGVPVCDATADVSEMSPSMVWTAGGMVSSLTVP